jgi:hypothetical protein
MAQQVSADLADALPPFSISAEVEEVARAVIRQHTSLEWTLDDFSVVFLLKNLDKVSAEDTIDTIAKCVKTPALWAALTGYDFAIWVKKCYWDLYPAKEREAIIAHELQHIGADDKERPTIVPHTVEEFAQTVRWYGPWSNGLAEIQRAFVKTIEGGKK